MSKFTLYHDQQGFWSAGNSIIGEKLFKEKNWFWHSNYTSAMLNEVDCDCESMQKGSWHHVQNWQILLVHVTGEFLPTKNKETEVGEVMQSSGRQNKNMKLWDVPEVTPIFHFALNFIWA